MSSKDQTAVKEYANLAPVYDQRWSFYVEATIKATIERLEKNPEGKILDLACGTGTLLNYLLEFIPPENLFGIDISEEMLAVAREKLPPAVNLSLWESHNFPFPNNHFEQVISTNSFHYFRQPQMVLQEVHRVLKPGGQLVITDWCRDFVTCRLLDWYLRWFNEAHFYTYNSKELPNLLEQAGFKNISVDQYKINWFWGMMTVKTVQ